MSETELEDKFRELAGRTIRRQQTDEALKLLWQVEQWLTKEALEG